LSNSLYTYTFNNLYENWFRIQLYEFHWLYNNIYYITPNQNLSLILWNLIVTIIIYKTTKRLTLDHDMLLFIHYVTLTSGTCYINYLNIIIYYKYNFSWNEATCFFFFKKFHKYTQTKIIKIGNFYTYIILYYNVKLNAHANNTIYIWRLLENTYT